MFTRPRRGALGLRGRIVGLVLFTTVATLAVAALTLLGPLESKLRNSALQTLVLDVEHNRPVAPSKFDLTYALDYVSRDTASPDYLRGRAPIALEEIQGGTNGRSRTASV